MSKRAAICVFCKKCGKPFSVCVAEYAAMDPDVARENRKYKKQGHRVELVADFDGVWCDCPRGEKGESKINENQMEMFV